MQSLNLIKQVVESWVLVTLKDLPLAFSIFFVGFEHVFCSQESFHSVCAPPPLPDGGLNLQINFQEGLCWERGGDFFHGGGAIFTKKKKKN